MLADPLNSMNEKHGTPFRILKLFNSKQLIECGRSNLKKFFGLVKTQFHKVLKVSALVQVSDRILFYAHPRQSEKRFEFVM